MSLDFTALAGSLAVGVPGVRACLFVSGDGLALASHPASEEAAALAAWARLNELGPLERGFVAMEHENWVFSRRAGYTGLVITDPAVRPGVLLDRLEQALQLAEESRSRHEGMSPVPGVVPMAAAAAKEPSRPARRIRLPVHREAPRGVPEPELIEAERVSASRPIAPPVASPPVAPSSPSPPAEPLSRPPRREVPVEESSPERPDPVAEEDVQHDQKPARAAKSGPKGRRGLGEYVGKHARGSGGKSSARRQAEREVEPEAEPEPEAEVEALPPQHHPDPEPVAEVEQAEEAVVEPAEEVPEEAPVAVQEPQPDGEVRRGPGRSKPLGADLETLLSSPRDEMPKGADPVQPQGAMLDAVSAALEAPGLAALPEVAAPPASPPDPEPEPVAQVPEPEPEPVAQVPEPVIPERVPVAQAPEPAVARLPAVEAPVSQPPVAAEPVAAVADAPQPIAETAPAPVPVAQAPEPAETAPAPVPVAQAPEPAETAPAPVPVAQAPEPVVAEPIAPEPAPAEPVAAADPAPAPAAEAEAAPPMDAVEEAKAAMWRRRMKAKTDAKDEEDAKNATQAAASEAASKIDAPDSNAEEAQQAVPDGEARVPSDVDVVALAREFSGLFGDEGGEG